MKASIYISLFLVSFMTLGQDWNLINTIKVEETIRSVSCDSKGMFYIGTDKGNIIRYDSLGQEDEYFSQVNNSPATTIQAWNRLKVFSFFRDQQTFSILDRFTATPRNTDIKSIGLRYAWLVAPGVDNSYWALSTEFKELVKYDDQNLNVLFRIVLPNDVKLTQATHLRAYKNLLILCDVKSGIWVFDQFGVLQGNIAVSGLSSIQMINNQIAGLSNQQIVYIDPFKLEVVEQKKAPEGAFRSVVIIGEKFIFFSEDSVALYQCN